VNLADHSALNFLKRHLKLREHVAALVTLVDKVDANAESTTFPMRL
jgi:hypothetical protein